MQYPSLSLFETAKEKVFRFVFCQFTVHRTKISYYWGHNKTKRGVPIFTVQCYGIRVRLCGKTTVLTGAERTIPMVHLYISDVTPTRHAQPTLSILRAFVLVACVVSWQQRGALRWFCLRRYRPLLRRSASDKRSVRCRPMKRRDKIYRNFWSKPTFDKVHFCPFFKNVPQKLPSGQFLEKYILKNVLSQTL